MRPASYTWNSSTEPLSIDLALDVVQRLSLAAMEAVKAVPRRGLEVGGILLGRTERRRGATAVYVRGFETVESEHRSGPSYRLSNADLEHLDETLRQHSGVVGLFRTQTRSDSLRAEEDDGALFNRYFTVPDRVFLLVQPVAGRAAFFLSRSGSLAPVHEFSFRVADLAPEGAAIAADKTRPAGKRPWLVPAIAGSLGLVAGAGLLHYGAERYRYRPQSAAVRPAPPEPEPLALEVRRDAGALRLIWDREAPQIRNADHATLYITDGSRKSTLNLDASELTTGLLSYWPETGDVAFRLEIFAGGRKSVNSIRAVSASPPAPGAEAAVAAHPAGYASREKRAEAEPKAVKPWNPASRQGSGEAGVVEPRPSPFGPPPAPILPRTRRVDQPAPLAKEPVAPAKPQAAPAPGPAPQREPEPSISTAVEPVRNSGLGRVFGRIPLLRRLRKSPQPYVPPEPVHRSEPVLTARQQREVTHAVPIDVKVYVSDTGTVNYAELLTEETSNTRELASAAVYAARHWQFTPARLNGSNVPGEVILHFRFRPPDLAQR